MYYLLVIKYSWTDRKVKKVEIWFHTVCLSFGLISATIAASLDLMHPANWNCWIAPDFTKNPDPNENLAKTLQWAIFYIPLWMSITLSAGCMVMIYSHVKKTELTSIRFSIRGSRSHLKRTKEVATQGKLFVGVFALTWLFPSTARLMQLIGQEAPDWLIVCAGTFVPSQGFFNAVVYFRIRFEKRINNDPSKPKWQIVLDIIKIALFPCCKQTSQGLPLQDNGNDCEPCPNDDRSGPSNPSSTDVFEGRGSEEILRSSVIGYERVASLKEMERENRSSPNNSSTHCGSHSPPFGNEECFPGPAQGLTQSNGTIEKPPLPSKAWNDMMSQSFPSKLSKIKSRKLSQPKRSHHDIKATSDTGAHDWRSLRARGVNVIKPLTKYSSHDCKASKSFVVHIATETESFEFDAISAFPPRNEVDNKSYANSLRYLDAGQVVSDRLERGSKAAAMFPIKESCLLMIEQSQKETENAEAVPVRLLSVTEHIKKKENRCVRFSI